MRLMQTGAAIAALIMTATQAAAQGGDTAKTPPPPAQASLYTDEQATRGEGVYNKVCADCHEKLEYSGPDFRTKWNGRMVFDLYDLLRTTMPDDKPGALPAQDYIDVVGYMMKLNGVPAGKTELVPTDSVLKRIKIEIPATLSAWALNAQRSALSAKR
ncbi:MAG TPA: cytochrome c [Gemmatimonadaceae bacterium]|nr:cytochrome c [Gemmatimonadaceae bacterium]